jgi:hypothetical protein
LDGGDGIDRGRQLVGRHDSVEVGQHVHQGFSA